VCGKVVVEDDVVFWCSARRHRDLFPHTVYLASYELPTEFDAPATVGPIGPTSQPACDVAMLRLGECTAAWEVNRDDRELQAACNAADRTHCTPISLESTR
jgi:hypothetical protein